MAKQFIGRDFIQNVKIFEFRVDFFLKAFAEPFQKAAAEAAVEAGAALSQGAKDAVEIIQQQHISKLKLDLVINAPLVIMPQNSRSDEAILVDFGKKMSNF